MSNKKFKARCLRLMALITAVLVLAGTFGACKRKEGDDSKASGTGAKTSASAAKTTPKSSESAKRSSTATTSTSAKASTGDARTEVPSGSDTGKDIDKRGEGSSDTEDVESGDGSDAISESVKIFDLKGRELKVVVWTDTMVPSPEPGNIGGPKMYALMKEAEEKFNCKFVFEVKANATILNNELQNSVMAGVYYADMTRITRSSACPVMEKNNILLPISDYIDFDQPVYKKYDQVNGVINPDKIYAFFNSTPLTPTGIWYNRDILEREGVPDLKEYYNNGNWNWDTFIDIAIKATRDFDGDGIIDQWGTGSETSTIMATSILRSNLASMIDYSPNNNLYLYNLSSPKALKALQFLSDMYHTYKVLPKGSALNDFRAGKVAMFIREAWYGLNVQTFGLENVGFTVLPSGPDNPQNTFMREQAGHFFFFPSNIQDPEAVVNAAAYWNVTWDESKDIYMTYEDMLITEAQRYFNKDENLNFYMNYMYGHNIVYDYIDYFNPSKTQITNNIFNKLADVQMSPASSIEAMKEAIQSIIDGIMN